MDAVEVAVEVGDELDLDGIQRSVGIQCARMTVHPGVVHSVGAIPGFSGQFLDGETFPLAVSSVARTQGFQMFPAQQVALAGLAPGVRAGDGGGVESMAVQDFRDVGELSELGNFQGELPVLDARVALCEPTGPDEAVLPHNLEMGGDHPVGQVALDAVPGLDELVDCVEERLVLVVDVPAVGEDVVRFALLAGNVQGALQCARAQMVVAIQEGDVAAPGHVHGSVLGFRNAEVPFVADAADARHVGDRGRDFGNQGIGGRVIDTDDFHGLDVLVQNGFQAPGQIRAVIKDGDHN